MIDGIKFGIEPNIIRSNDILRFHRKDDARHTAKYKGLIIDLYPDSCYVRGSIHKYRNEGIHNADDFKLSDFVRELNDLAVTLNFNPESTPFHSLEFGVNIEPPCNINLLTNSIAYCRNGNIVNTPHGIDIIFSEYRVKVYKKEAKTCLDIPENVLRYEISINKVRKLREFAKDVEFCTTLSDLSNPLLWRSLGNVLLNTFDDTLIVDRGGIDVHRLSPDEAALYVNGCTSGYWIAKWDDRMKKKRTLERFEEIVKQHSVSTMKNDVRNLIEAKINTLIDIQNVTKSPFGKSVENWKYVTKSPFGKSEPKETNLLQNHHLGSTLKNNKMLRFHHLDNGGFRNISLPQNRLCKVTGLNLEIGIKQGEYLTAKGVEFYYHNHPEIFVEKLFSRLSEKWKSESLKIQFREIAHSIRNEIYNPKNNFGRQIQKRKIRDMSFMFDLSEMVY